MIEMSNPMRSITQKRFGLSLYSILMILMVLYLGGCGDIVISPHDLTPYPTPPSTIPELIEATKSPDYKMRVSAIAALGELGAEAEIAVPALITALSDNASEVSITAATALGDIGPAAASAVPELVEILQNDERRYAHSAAATALGDIGPLAASAVPELVEILQNDEGRYARSAAAYALGQIDDTSVVPVLAAILYQEDASKSLKIQTAKSLAYLTENDFIDSEPGKHGFRLDEEGTPLIVLDAINWWEAEGQYQEWYE